MGSVAMPPRRHRMPNNFTKTGSFLPVDGRLVGHSFDGIHALVAAHALSFLNNQGQPRPEKHTGDTIPCGQNAREIP